MTGLKTLIVVEDEFRIRDGLSRLIQRLNMGVKVIGEAENGDDPGPAAGYCNHGYPNA